MLEYHKRSMQQLNNFVPYFQNSTTCIDQPITQIFTTVVNLNKQVLQIEHYGCQGIALICHRDMDICLIKLILKKLRILMSEYEKT